MSATSSSSPRLLSTLLIYLDGQSMAAASESAQGFSIPVSSPTTSQEDPYRED